jgi:hypothetical protein
MMTDNDVTRTEVELERSTHGALGTTKRTERENPRKEEEEEAEGSEEEEVEDMQSVSL